MTIQEHIRKRAMALGFDAVGFCAPDVPERARHRLEEFVLRGEHGDMGWMADKASLRASPEAIWPEAKSVIVVGHNYAPARDPMKKLADKSAGNISCYALGDDYHDVIKKKLRELARWLTDTYDCDVKLFVDTAPIMEKPLAEAAGIGWIGKHTCLVSREFGSWLFLGCVFTTVVIPSEAEGSLRSFDFGLSASAQDDKGHCGTCSKCLDVCPTQAFTTAGKLDARRCIAYLTNEHKGHIPLEFRKSIGNRIYGCDDCLAVCPWNKFAETSKESAYHAREALDSPRLRDLVQLDDTSFRQLFRKSPVKRIGRDRFLRNVLIAIGNSEDESLIDVTKPLLSDPSALVAEMAAWAIHQLKESSHA